MTPKAPKSQRHHTMAFGLSSEVIRLQTCMIQRPSTLKASKSSPGASLMSTNSTDVCSSRAQPPKSRQLLSHHAGLPTIERRNDYKNQNNNTTLIVSLTEQVDTSETEPIFYRICPLTPKHHWPCSRNKYYYCLISISPLTL